MDFLKAFEKNGARLLIPENSFHLKLQSVKAFVFDWDGVFTDGGKDHELQSTFNEADSMGTNLLRFCFFIKHGQIPITSIISGENNKTAFTFVNRECFHGNYFKVSNKIDAANHLSKTFNLSVDQIAFVFDDVLDLSIAQSCGLRIFIPRKANPLFNEYVIKNKLADYVTASESGHFAVRESCEFLMGAYGLYDEVVKQRSAFSDKYNEYLQLRKATVPKHFTSSDGSIIEAKN
jgi:3-deoxy-D-manno-octulosonate 8-phosphate phosphatase (KDO 8-P phosphatase)